MGSGKWPGKENGLGRTTRLSESLCGVPTDLLIVLRESSALLRPQGSFARPGSPWFWAVIRCQIRAKQLQAAVRDEC